MMMSMSMLLLLSECTTTAAATTTPKNTNNNKFDTAAAAMMEKMKAGRGFLAALDQSGGSTPKALEAYGIPEDSYTTPDSMYTVVHAMRTRIMTSPSFTSANGILGAILFENTMDRNIPLQETSSLPTAAYLWKVKGIVPFLKCDAGLAPLNEHGVQLMREEDEEESFSQLDTLLQRATSKGVFGTKMRSLIHAGATRTGIQMVVDQQFRWAKHILVRHGLVPILEPEIQVHSDNKAALEGILQECLVRGLENELDDGQVVMLKLSLPTVPNQYQDCSAHPRCLCVVALSGGVPREKANALLSQQRNMIASFSRALLEGLSHEQTQHEFDATLARTIESIYKASMAGGGEEQQQE